MRLIREYKDMAGRLLDRVMVIIHDEDLPLVFNTVELDLLAKGETVILCDPQHEMFSHYTLPHIN